MQLGPDQHRRKKRNKQGSLRKKQAKKGHKKQTRKDRNNTQRQHQQRKQQKQEGRQVLDHLKMKSNRNTGWNSSDTSIKVTTTQSNTSKQLKVHQKPFMHLHCIEPFSKHSLCFHSSLYKEVNEKEEEYRMKFK